MICLILFSNYPQPRISYQQKSPFIFIVVKLCFIWDFFYVFSYLRILIRILICFDESQRWSSKQCFKELLGKSQEDLTYLVILNRCYYQFFDHVHVLNFSVSRNVFHLVSILEVVSQFEKTFFRHILSLHLSIICHDIFKNTFMVLLLSSIRL